MARDDDDAVAAYEEEAARAWDDERAQRARDEPLLCLLRTLGTRWRLSVEPGASATAGDDEQQFVVRSGGPGMRGAAPLAWIGAEPEQAGVARLRHGTATCEVLGRLFIQGPELVVLLRELAAVGARLRSVGDGGSASGDDVAVVEGLGAQARVILNFVRDAVPPDAHGDGQGKQG